MIEELIEHFGGVTRTAEAFGVRPPSVCEWRERGQLPVGRCLDAERLSRGAFTRYQLRPDLFGPAPESEAA
jgi:DNA-binding transcriptional regulator YdaS (Cro superfamily)